MPHYQLGLKSRSNLAGVHPDLARVVQRAIELSAVDFQVFEGLRSLERQKQLFAKGASTTLNSKHLRQADGHGHAVDLVPLIDFDGDGDTELRWDWPLCYKVAEAMRTASAELGVKIRWGGVWDRTLADLGGDLEECVAAYVKRRKATGERAFTDGPHFEVKL
jgi:peptidoglycan L-alanyl-D-glutamate endopeptidase CwlK